jgi:hypothetical protein
VGAWVCRGIIRGWVGGMAAVSSMQVPRHVLQLLLSWPVLLVPFLALSSHHLCLDGVDSAVTAPRCAPPPLLPPVPACAHMHTCIPSGTKVVDAVYLYLYMYMCMCMYM